ncbi:MAG TPA: ATP-binding protein [Dissulfurispiraceae bacterium]|nr:ATP-binding protein [Dissulfurispiraceae bacterium]
MEIHKGGDLSQKATSFPLRWIDFYIRHYAMVTAAVTIILLFVILLLGWISDSKNLIELFAVTVTIVAGLFLIVLLQRWSSAVSQEVEIKTRQLNRSEHLYRSLVENANDIIFTISPEGTILSMNHFGAEFFRKGPAEIAGKMISELLPAESAEMIMQVETEIFDTKVSRRINCKANIDDSEKWLNISLSALIDEYGNVYKILGIGRDVTERRKNEEQMIYTEKLASMGTLAAGVAHEINNPLAVILGFTDMLLEKKFEDPEAYDILRTIEKQALNAKRVVEKLLSFARHSESKEEDVDINNNVDEVLDVIGRTIILNKVTTIKDFASSLPAVRGEPGEFQQVFFNLINNALAVMKGGGILTVCTRVVDGGRSVEVRISDTGCGIKKEHRTKIFDPLFTTKKVGEGTGLGLSVSYGIVTHHGGTLTFETKTQEESDSPGTTFIVTLPAVKK